MQRFKKIYIIISYSLLLIQLIFLAIIAYTKIRLGSLLYYGNPEELSPIFHNYFLVLQFQLYSTFGLIIIWGILTPFAFIYNRRSLKKDKINMFPGVIGFVVAMILLVADPFGVFKWFTA